MNKILKDIEENRTNHLNQMIRCLKFETVSADPRKAGEIRRCGDWLVGKLKDIGFENAGLAKTGGFPAVYADWLHAGEGKPTIMVYGHFDVQPVDPVEKWSSPPFEPVIKDGYIYARGSSDDKAQLLTHIFALESIMKVSGRLPVNVKVFLESEEEGGTGSTTKFVEDNANLLACDAVLISDTAWPSPDLPTIIYALRGIVYFEVRIKGPNRDLHSGTFGGKVENPLRAMTRIISKLYDDDNRLAIPGIYDDVAPLKDIEKKEFDLVAPCDREIMKYLGVNSLAGEKGFTTCERNWARPALDVNGIWGGYAGEGSKTVIPSECGFKISMRIVPNQTVERVRKLFTDYVKKISPPGVTTEVIFMHGGDPVMVPIDNPFIACARNAVERAFGKRPVLVREGASIPISALFIKELGAPPILMGFGVEDDSIHSPNERFRLEHFYKGIVASAYFFNEVHF